MQRRIRNRAEGSLGGDRGHRLTRNPLLFQARARSAEPRERVAGGMKAAMLPTPLRFRGAQARPRGWYKKPARGAGGAGRERQSTRGMGQEWRLLPPLELTLQNDSAQRIKMWKKSHSSFSPRSADAKERHSGCFATLDLLFRGKSPEHSAHPPPLQEPS